MRRITIILAAAIGCTLSFPPVASADHAGLGQVIFDLAPGEVVEHDDVLFLSHFGIPTVVFDGATGFADDETVVATITLSTEAIDGLGSVELLSSPTISGTTPADWTTGEVPDAITFQPAIELRYTAPSSDELGCDDHPGDRFATHLGVSGALVGSAGTMASFSADDFPGYVAFNITCPASAPGTDTPTVTTPPTDTLPAMGRTGSRADWPGSLPFLAVAAAAGALVVLTRLSRSRRSRP